MNCNDNTMSDSEMNGNVIGEHRVTTGSVEDLSEYTDADESISAPTEILAEFLSAIMLKDYETALKYCKLILHYEPNNSTAREFYPLIEEKIEIMRAEENESDEDTSSDYSDSATNGSSSHSLTSGEESESKSSDSDATSASYSSLEDEEADRETNGNNLTEQATASLSPNDIANGNTTCGKESSNVRGILSTPNVGTKAENKSISGRIRRSEELRRKLESLATQKMLTPAENLKSFSFPAKKVSGVLPTSPKNQRPRPVLCGDKSGELRNRIRSSLSYCPPMKSSPDSPNPDKAPASIPFSVVSSDSESPTDPTVQELRKKSLGM